MSPSPRDNWYLAQGDECSSGSASKRSLYATYTHTYWKNEKYKRDTPQYKSKWRKRKDRRNFRGIPKGFYGYKKEAVKLNWIKHTKTINFLLKIKKKKKRQPTGKREKNTRKGNFPITRKWITYSRPSFWKKESFY